MQKKENRPRVKIEDIKAKKLSAEELAAVTGGVSNPSLYTCSGGCCDDCG